MNTLLWSIAPLSLLNILNLLHPSTLITLWRHSNLLWYSMISCPPLFSSVWAYSCAPENCARSQSGSVATPGYDITNLFSGWMAPPLICYHPFQLSSLPALFHLLSEIQCHLLNKSWHRSKQWVKNHKKKPNKVSAWNKNAPEMNLPWNREVVSVKDPDTSVSRTHGWTLWQPSSSSYTPKQI